MTKRKLSNKSKSFIREVQDQYQFVVQGNKKIQRELEAGNRKLLEFLNRVPPWIGFYSLSYQKLACIFYIILGYEDHLRKILEIGDKREINMSIFREIVKKSEGEEIYQELDELTLDEQSGFLSLLIAMTRNMQGLSGYNMSIDQLICRIPVDDEALFSAVNVDRSVVGHPIVASRISRAELCQDNPFMDRLAKAVTKTLPRRDYRLDDTRFLLEIIDEIEGLDSVANEELTDFFINDLETYPSDRNNPEAAIAKLIQRRKIKKET